MKSPAELPHPCRHNLSNDLYSFIHIQDVLFRIYAEKSQLH